MTLRQAALTAGFAYLIQTVVVPAEFFVFPKLLVPHDITQTAANIVANDGLYFFGVFAYLANFMCDIVIAWGLYILFVPVNKPLSLLTAWFQPIYTAVALVAWVKLVDVYRLLTTPDFLALFGSGQLHAQVRLLLSSWRYEWAISLTIFGIHLCLLGYLIYRSGYVPKIIGILIAIDGAATIIDKLQPYLFPGAHLGFLFPIFFFEWILIVWLLIGGWKIQEPPAIRRAVAV